MAFEYSNESIDRQSSTSLGESGKLRPGIKGVKPATTGSGHYAAFEAIWRSHAKRILRIAERITRNREDAEDAVQDSFLRAYVHLHDFDGRSSLSTWLTRIAINSALMILRKRGTAGAYSLDDLRSLANSSVADLIPDHALGPEERYAQREREAILLEGVGALRPTIRAALELQTFQEHSLKETANVMGLSLAATKSRLFHAKKALRKSLQPKICGRIHGTGRLQTSPA
jgi:RNA polymerase sigma-70 factor (ECF subfamily)